MLMKAGELKRAPATERAHSFTRRQADCCTGDQPRRTVRCTARLSTNETSVKTDGTDLLAPVV